MIPKPPDNLAVIVCDHVFRVEREVLLVAREDERFCFMCGHDDHEQSAESFIVVGAGHLLDRDATLNLVCDLEVGYEAERSARGQPWLRRPCSPD